MKSMKLTMQLILVRTIKMKTRSIGIFYRNDVVSTQFANELNNTYEKNVHWKRNLCYQVELLGRTILKK